MKIINRDIPPRALWTLEQAGIHPLLARLYASRGMSSADDLDDSLGRLLPPSSLHQADTAARLLADALSQGLRVCIVADYDCDGATACAVGLRGLRMLEAAVARHLQRPPSLTSSATWCPTAWPTATASPPPLPAAWPPPVPRCW